MEINLVISLIALTFSAVSLCFTAYNILRDREKIKVWSEIYNTGSSDPDNPFPNIKIRMVNCGRRPVVISHLVFENPQIAQINFIRLPQFPTNENGNVKNAPRIEDYRTQNTCIALNEGEAYDYFIKYHDLELELIMFEHGAVENIYVEDVKKKRHYVKDSNENIKKLLSYKRTPRQIKMDEIVKKDLAELEAMEEL